MKTLVVFTSLMFGLTLLLYLDSPLKLILTNIYQEAIVTKARRYVLLATVVLFVITVTVIPYRIVKRHQVHNKELDNIEADLKWPTGDQQIRSMIERIPDKPQTQITLIARDGNSSFTTILSNAELILLHNTIKPIVDDFIKENAKKK